jgi:FAD/FMN-containing dehydrogenase/Fe-S oxidoreductase
MIDAAHLAQLSADLSGALHTDTLHQILYATDASVYRSRPLAVAYPRDTADVQTLVRFAARRGVPLTPRGAGTSLAGQATGTGIVVDLGRHMNQILAIDAERRRVRVQPGVIRDELNEALRPHGLWFGPNTSTANRCMIGGMVGNNSSGTTSIRYGVTRDYVRELQAVLSDGSVAVFGDLDAAAFAEKCQRAGREGELYRQIAAALRPAAVQARIRREFPKPDIHRRNTGYAVDQLLDRQPFQPDGAPFNFCQLLTGSEGTLAIATEIELAVQPLPPPEVAVICAHFHRIADSMDAVPAVMRLRPYACELMDKTILDLTKENIAQQRNRFFVTGDPEAVLMIEVRGRSTAELDDHIRFLAHTLEQSTATYALPVVRGADTQRVWALRAAGLGILANLPGDKKAVACIEDTAVSIDDLADYIAEFGRLMEGFGQRAVYYAHAGAGEIHLRPILDLKRRPDRQLFHDITAAVATLVKKYGGSLSGEHGDGRVRGPFIEQMIGPDNYDLLRQIKATWDPQHLFNPGKIIDVPPMTEDLRYAPDQETPEYSTAFDFTAVGGILRLAEKCNGSGDCRKLNFSGGTMCPSYRATRNERDTTRGRANALREILTLNARDNPFAHPALDEAMDLCLSCKGCTAECPSNVDMATLKAEYLYQRYQTTGVPLRARAFGEIDRINGLLSRAPQLGNLLLRTTGGLAKRLLGVAPQRNLPALSAQSLRRWWNQTGRRLPIAEPRRGEVFLFCDEFTDYNDAPIGRAAIQLLCALGYRVHLPEHAASGRAQISKGLLERARDLAASNVGAFAQRVTVDRPLVGIEPSAILSFRDEYPKLLRGELAEKARRLAAHTLTIEEFLSREAQQGRIGAEDFTTASAELLVHGHCHQKALSSVDPTAFLLGLPPNYHVSVIPSGCCGMAGSFGYEREHYAISMQIGEQVLFPAVRAAAPNTKIVAPGTSCRHQILDGTGRSALHPVEVLWESLKR